MIATQPVQDLTVPVLAIDGGAGTGKGTVRAIVAEELGFAGFDSGLLYRAVGMKAGREDAPSQTLVRIALCLDIRMVGQTVYVDGVDQTREIRSDAAGKLASVVAKVPEVRRALLSFQLDMRKLPGLVTDGRDQGFIFETPYRYFFKTDAEERARRRVRQFEGLGQPADYEAILAEIRRRDESDRTNAASPLRPHPDAIVIDTTRISARQVADAVLRHYRGGS